MGGAPEVPGVGPRRRELPRRRVRHGLRQAAVLPAVGPHRGVRRGADARGHQHRGDEPRDPAGRGLAQDPAGIEDRHRLCRRRRLALLARLQPRAAGPVVFQDHHAHRDRGRARRAHGAAAPAGGRRPGARGEGARLAARLRPLFPFPGVVPGHGPGRGDAAQRRRPGAEGHARQSQHPPGQPGLGRARADAAFRARPGPPPAARPHPGGGRRRAAGAADRHPGHPGARGHPRRRPHGPKCRPGAPRSEPARRPDATNRDGKLIPLSQIGHVEILPEDPILRRRDRVPTITVQSDIDETLQPPQVAAEIEQALKPVVAALPPGYHIETGGNAEESAKANTALAPIFPIMIALILLVLMLQVRTFSAMFMVFLTAPLGLVGIVPALLIFHQPFGFNGILGLIGLSGILMRNTLILIGQIHTNEEEGLDRYHAVVEATVQRARPVVLTALAAILAFTPLTQSVFWGSLAYTLIGGTAGGTVLVLVFLPALYAIWYKVKPTRNEDAGALALPPRLEAAD